MSLEEQARLPVERLASLGVSRASCQRLDYLWQAVGAYLEKGLHCLARRYSDQFYTLLDAEASRTGNQGDLVKHVEERCDFCNCRRLIGSTCSTRLRHRKPGSLASRRLKRKAASAGGKPVRFKNELVQTCKLCRSITRTAGTAVPLKPGKKRKRRKADNIKGEKAPEASAGQVVISASKKNGKKGGAGNSTGEMSILEQVQNAHKKAKRLEKKKREQSLGASSPRSGSLQSVQKLLLGAGK